MTISQLKHGTTVPDIGAELLEEVPDSGLLAGVAHCARPGEIESRSILPGLPTLDDPVEARHPFPQIEHLPLGLDGQETNCRPAALSTVLITSSSRYSKDTACERASDISETKMSRGSPSTQGLSRRAMPARERHAAAFFIRPGKRVTSSKVGA
jgi:hypothetical protein